MISKDHYRGFEDAKVMHELLEHFDSWQDVIQHLGIDFYQEAFRRIPCVRTLRYIGFAHWPELDRPESADDFFVVGKIYRSIDFNGATYTIENYGDGTRKIGFAYFDWIDRPRIAFRTAFT